MEIAAKLFVDTLRYSDLLAEFKRLPAKQLHEIRDQNSAFVDWLVDPSVNKLSSNSVQKFRRLIQYAVKQKVELLLTAVGPLKVEETPSRLFRCDDFISVNFLKTLFLSESGFTLIDKEGVECVQITSSTLGKTEMFNNSDSISALSSASKNRDQITSTMEPGTNCSSSWSPSLESTNSANSVSSRGFNSDDCDNNKTLSKQESPKADPRASQLRFLFKCQPDVVAALQPTVSLLELFKAFSFWKSYCTHSQSTFITWLLEMAQFRYSQVKPNSTLSYSLYLASVKKVLAREADNYITTKSRTPAELITLVSKNQTGFVDEKFLVEALQENSLSCGKSAVETPILSPSRFGNIVSKQVPTKSDSGASMDNLSNKTDSTTSIKRCNLTVIDASCDMTCRLRGVAVPKDVRAKMLPLLTVNTTWKSLSHALDSISCVRQSFLNDLSRNFVSFVEFLIEFADKFKTSFDKSLYSSHLASLLVKECFNLCSKNFIKLDDLSEALQLKDCHLKLVHKQFLLDMLKANQNAFDQNKNDGSLSVRKRSPDEETKETSFEKLLKLPQLQSLFVKKIEFADILQTYRILPAHAKKLLEDNSHSFYSVVFETARKKERAGRSKVSLQRLRQIILSRIELLFYDCSATSLPLIDAQVRICCGDFSLINCPDIRDAIENSPRQSTFKIRGSSIYRRKVKTPNNREGICKVRDSVHFDAPFHGDSQAFIKDVLSALESSDVPIRRLDKLFFHVNQMPYVVRQYVQRHNCSVFRYLVESLPSTDILYAVLRQELLHYLENATYFAGDLLRDFFRRAPNFMDMDELVNFFVRFRDSFVVVGHETVGNIVCAVRHLDSKTNIAFFDQHEEITFMKVQGICPKQRSGILFKRFYDIVWHSAKLSSSERNFIFGLPRNGNPFAFHEIHFRRYMLMYPATFRINGKHVFPSFADGQQEKIPSVFPVLDDDVLSEEGQITSNDDMPSKPKKASKSKAVLEEDQPSKKRKRKKGKGRKKHSSRKLRRRDGETDETTTEALTELINFLPDNLIQDVAVGRLLSSEQHQMKVHDLSDMLGSRLLRDKKEIIWKNTKLINTFESKVMSVLKHGSQFDVQEIDSDEKSSRTVSLVVQMPTVLNTSSLASPALPVAVRWTTRLTGVTQKKLAVYIKKILDVNKEPLNMSILFSMVCQKFGNKKTVAETPNEVLHCQAISCMNSIQDIFINCIRKTCCLQAFVKEHEQQESLQNTIKDFSEEIVSSISEFLQEKDVSAGLTVEQLSKKVAAKFGHKLPKLSVGSFRIIVQSLVAESEQFGFTHLGKVAFQAGDSTHLSQETLESSSDDELKMDLSEDEAVVFPDSTNKELSEQAEDMEIVIEEIIEEGSDSSPQADVIRCDYEVPKAKLASADSTTANENDNSSVPSCSNTSDNHDVREDPRIKGKAFRNMLLTKNENLLSSSKSQTDVANENNGKLLKHSRASRKKSKPSKQRPHHLERFKKIQEFATEFLMMNGRSCETQKLVNAAYNHFKNERFAKSMLGLEAYVRDFIATSDNDTFTFANSYGDTGASRVYYRPSGRDLNCGVQASVPCSELLHEICNTVYDFLISKSTKQADLTSICKRVVECFPQNMVTLDPKEVFPVCRNLVLIACIRNLKWFFFAKVEDIVHIRQEKTVREMPLEDLHIPVTSHSEETTTSTTSSDYYVASVSSTTATVSRNRKQNSTAKATVAALQQMAAILRVNGPCRKDILRNMWSQQTAPHLQKVFGTGVSFSLSLRKFDMCFPTNNEGKVYVDEDAFENFLRDNA